LLGIELPALAPASTFGRPGCFGIAEVPALPERGGHRDWTATDTGGNLVLQSGAASDRAIAHTEPARTNSAGYIAFIVIVTFMCNVFLGEDTRAISLSAPLIMKEFGITAAQLGFAQTIANWIGLLGWFGVLIMADGLGRKPAFLTVLFGFSITAPLIGTAGGFNQLIGFMALAALFRNTGTINYVVLAETAPASIRAILLAFLNSSVVLAYMAAALLAGVIVPAFGWRAMFFLDASCILVAFAALIWMRETEAFRHASRFQERIGHRQRPDLLLPWRAYLGRAILGFTITVVYLGAYPAFSAWQTAWLVNEVKIPFSQSTHWIAIWLGASALAYWSCGYLSNRYGKKRAIPLFAGLGGCFFLAIICGTWTPETIFWLGLGLNFFVTGHYGSGSYAYVNELFPAQIRGSVQASFAVFAGFTVSFAPAIPPLIAGNRLDHISLGFLFPMVLTFMAAAIFAFIAPETARKPLQDVVQRH
jgi:MFS transporter, AAHS family, cis,cis-muconate transporter